MLCASPGMKRSPVIGAGPAAARAVRNSPRPSPPSPSAQAVAGLPSSSAVGAVGGGRRRHPAEPARRPSQRRVRIVAAGHQSRCRRRGQGRQHGPESPGVEVPGAREQPRRRAVATADLGGGLVLDDLVGGDVDVDRHLAVAVARAGQPAPQHLGRPGSQIDQPFLDAGAAAHGDAHDRHAVPVDRLLANRRRPAPQCRRLRLQTRDGDGAVTQIDRAAGRRRQLDRRRAAGHRRQQQRGQQPRVPRRSGERHSSG